MHKLNPTRTYRHLFFYKQDSFNPIPQAMNKIAYIPAHKNPFPFGEREKRQGDKVISLVKEPNQPQKKNQQLK